MKNKNSNEGGFSMKEKIFRKGRKTSGGHLFCADRSGAKMKKRLFSVVLALVIVISLMPINTLTVFAASGVMHSDGTVCTDPYGIYFVPSISHWTCGWHTLTVGDVLAKGVRIGDRGGLYNTGVVKLDDNTLTNGSTLPYDAKIDAIDSSNGILTLSANYTHDWAYSTNGAVLTATCDKVHDAACTESVSLTLTASDANYSGSAVEVTMNKTAWEAAGLTAPSIVYEAKTGSALTDNKAVNVGSYTAKITVGDPAVTASVDFDIHGASTTYDSDDTYHWFTCALSGCTNTDDAHKFNKATHSYNETSHKCVCGKVDPAWHQHSFATEWTKTANGHYHACTVDGCDVTDFTTHTDDGFAYAAHTGGTATCQTKKACSVCGEKYGDLAGHAYATEFTEDTAATCTEKGSKSKHCTTTGCTEKTEVTEIPETTDHKWDVGKVTKEATVDAEGVKTYTCTVCNKTKEEAIAKLVVKEAHTDTSDLALDSKFQVITGKNITVKWGKVAGASGYDVYMAYCGSNNKLTLVKSVKGAKTVSAVIKKLNKKSVDQKKHIICYVVAYKMVNGKKVVLAKTITAHVVGAKNKTATDAKKITLSKSSYTLAVSKTATIKAKTVKVNKKRKLLNHVAEFRYATSDKKVATVSKTGKITAKGKGTCYVYVYAVNGCAKKVKVTVK